MSSSTTDRTLTSTMWKSASELHLAPTFTVWSWRPIQNRRRLPPCEIPRPIQNGHRLQPRESRSPDQSGHRNTKHLGSDFHRAKVGAQFKSGMDIQIQLGVDFRTVEVDAKFKSGADFQTGWGLSSGINPTMFDTMEIGSQIKFRRLMGFNRKCVPLFRRGLSDHVLSSLDF